MIQTESLRFAYPADEGQKPVYAIRGVDLEIKNGSFVVILGHNGSGKSTLAKTFNAVLLPAGGKVYVEGMDTLDQDLLLAIRQRVGMVFQNPDNQIVANVVEEDVAFAPENLGVPTEEIRRRVDGALKAVGMDEFVTHAPHLLSGGQKQRIAIAGVIAMEPACVVLDEATASVDPENEAELQAAIEALTHNKTIVMIAHRLKTVRNADQILVLDGGHIVQRGTHEELLGQPGLYARFIGERKEAADWKLA